MKAIENGREIGLHRIKSCNNALAGTFMDFEEEPCSIQESVHGSLYLGRDDGTCGSADCHGKMHLTREMAQALIPHLQHFVATGKLQELDERH